ncbi:MAG: hypothetical protein WDZ96_02185 [Acidimicrobiia bacterium]
MARQKDHFLRHVPGSPIPQHSMVSFNGLDYHPPDPAIDLELDIESADGRRVLLETSDGAQRVDRKERRRVSRSMGSSAPTTSSGT